MISLLSVYSLIMIASFFPYSDMRFVWWLLLPIAAAIVLFGISSLPRRIMHQANCPRRHELLCRFATAALGLFVYLLISGSGRSLADLYGRRLLEVGNGWGWWWIVLPHLLGLPAGMAVIIVSSRAKTGSVWRDVLKAWPILPAFLLPMIIMTFGLDHYAYGRMHDEYVAQRAERLKAAADKLEAMTAACRRMKLVACPRATADGASRHGGTWGTLRSAERQY